mmetsp:Transcript_14684/g.48609  ORF Transcript_14684/g.48609 Transcript_14684/m.48609 type:complete len:557 (-) Transcript_14684:89-1759(-)
MTPPLFVSTALFTCRLRCSLFAIHPGTDDRVSSTIIGKISLFLGTTHGFWMSKSLNASFIQSECVTAITTSLCTLSNTDENHVRMRSTSALSVSSFPPSARSSSASKPSISGPVQDCHPLFATSVKPQLVPTYLNSRVWCAIGSPDSSACGTSPGSNPASCIETSTFKKLGVATLMSKTPDPPNFSSKPSSTQQLPSWPVRPLLGSQHVPPGPFAPPWPARSAGFTELGFVAGLGLGFRAAFVSFSVSEAAAARCFNTDSGTKETGLRSSKGTLASMRSRKSSLTTTFLFTMSKPVWFCSSNSVVCMHRDRGDEKTFTLFPIAAPKPFLNTSRTNRFVSLLPTAVSSGSTKSPGSRKSHGMSSPLCAWCCSLPHSLCVALPCRMKRNSFLFLSPDVPIGLALIAALIWAQPTVAPYFGSCCNNGRSSCVSSKSPCVHPSYANIPPIAVNGFCCGSQLPVSTPLTTGSPTTRSAGVKCVGSVGTSPSRDSTSPANVATPAASPVTAITVTAITHNPRRDVQPVLESPAGCNKAAPSPSGRMFRIFSCGLAAKRRAHH